MTAQLIAIWFFLFFSSIVINSGNKVRNFQLLPQHEFYLGQKSKTIHQNMPTMKHKIEMPALVSS